MEITGKLKKKNKKKKQLSVEMAFTLIKSKKKYFVIMKRY